MSKNNNTIEINGRRYDAHTGAALDASSPSQKPVRRSVDGVLAHSPKLATPKLAQPAKPMTTPKPLTVVKKASLQDVVRHPAKPAQGHRPQPAHTLMRSTVKKPTASSKRQLVAHSRVDSLIKPPQAVVTPKLSVQTIDNQRLHHAKRIAKSRLVSRFSPMIAEAPVAAHSHRLAPPQPSAVSLNNQTAKSSNLFEQAIAQATSHQQTPLPKQRRGLSRRITSISAVAAVVVVLGGLFTVQNLNNIHLHLASAKAGFSAGLPGYEPAGYTMNKVIASSGLVAVHFHSNSDSRTYSLTEQPSSWDSATLRDMYVQPHDASYQTVETAGRTIYLYGDNQATWVNGGIWYQVQSNGSLSDHQLVELASSL